MNIKRGLRIEYILLEFQFRKITVVRRKSTGKQRVWLNQMFKNEFLSDGKTLAPYTTAVVLFLSNYMYQIC